MYDGKVEAGEKDRKFGATSAVSLALCRTVAAKTELSRKIKRFINGSVYVPTLSEPLVMSFGQQRKGPDRGYERLK